MARKIEVEILGDSRSLERAFGRAGAQGGKFGSVLSGLGKVALAAGAAIGAGLGIAAKIGFDEFMEGQRVAAQTNAVLKSTGGIANVTAKQVDALSVSLMKKSGVDDEAIKSGSNMLLTFTKIRNEAGKGKDIFTQATKATLNFAVAMGKDMKSSAILVGKALNDPIRGMTALGRAGVQFTDAQKKSIAAMVESGNRMGAQKLILKELAVQFGHSAVAAGKTFSGQLNILKETFTNTAGEIVGRFVPLLVQLANTVLPFVAKALDFVVQVITGLIAPFTSANETITKTSFAATKFAIRAQAAFAIVWGWIKKNLVPIFLQLRDIAVASMARIGAVVQAHMPEIRRIMDRVGSAISAIAKVAIPLLRFAFVTVLPTAIGIAIKAIDKISLAVETVVGWFKTLWGWIIDVKNALSNLKVPDITPGFDIPGVPFARAAAGGGRPAFAGGGFGGGGNTYIFPSLVPFTADQARRVVEMTSAGAAQQPHRTPFRRSVGL